MSTYTPKFKVGDTVYRLSKESHRVRTDCTLCDGKGNVLISGTSRKTRCPDCRFGTIVSDSPLEQIVTVDTIGQLRIEDTRGTIVVAYMLEGTGVGSGSVWPEDKLYRSRPEAQFSADKNNRMAKEQK